MQSRLKQFLQNLGYSSISSTNNHAQALDRMKGRKFSLVFFDAVETNMSPIAFVQAAALVEEEAHLIALSAQPPIDHVFELLRAGARWFLVTPFTEATLEEVIAKAVEGPPFIEGVFDAPDRNAALVSIILNTLEDLAAAKRHVRSFPTAPVQTQLYAHAFSESVQLAKTFAEGGALALRDKICDGCLNRAMNASTRLGRVRKRLQKLRTKTPPTQTKANTGRSAG